MTGFQNAPHITKFKRGMRVQLDDDPWCTVEWVHGDGDAECHFDEYKRLRFSPALIPRLTLDPDSIWEGREYEAKSPSQQRVRVVALSDNTGDVVYVSPDSDTLSTMPAEVFRSAYHPSPAPEPQPSREEMLVQRMIDAYRTFMASLCRGIEDEPKLRAELLKVLARERP